MNIMKLLKNILTAAALVFMAAGLSSCYFRISDDAKSSSNMICDTVCTLLKEKLTP